jgi:hypothetical protein
MSPSQAWLKLYKPLIYGRLRLATDAKRAQVLAKDK